MDRALITAKALADGSRMRIVAALLSYDELCVCQIIEMLQLSAATVSRHVAILQNANLVKSRKEGRWVYYRRVCPFPQLLQRWLSESLADSREIKEDRALLERILVCNPEQLCRAQKERK